MIRGSFGRSYSSTFFPPFARSLTHSFIQFIHYSIQPLLHPSLPSLRAPPIHPHTVVREATKQYGATLRRTKQIAHARSSTARRRARTRTSAATARAKSMPAVTPPPVNTRPSRTTLCPLTGVAPNGSSRCSDIQCVVARLPFFTGSCAAGRATTHFVVVVVVVVVVVWWRWWAGTATINGGNNNSNNNDDDDDNNNNNNNNSNDQQRPTTTKSENE
jgi:hypothetical protein